MGSRAASSSGRPAPYELQLVGKSTCRCKLATMTHNLIDGNQPQDAELRILLSSDQFNPFDIASETASVPWLSPRYDGSTAEVVAFPTVSTCRNAKCTDYLAQALLGHGNLSTSTHKDLAREFSPWSRSPPARDVIRHAPSELNIGKWTVTNVQNASIGEVNPRMRRSIRPTRTAVICVQS
jgi:hypothetical protein